MRANQPNSPLSGLRVLLTRPSLQMESSVAFLTSRGAEVLCAPCLRPVLPSGEAETRALLELIASPFGKRYDAFAWASAAAVVSFVGFLRDKGMPAEESLEDLVHGAVGQKTAEALRSLGCHKVLVPHEGAQDGVGLAALLVEESRKQGWPLGRILCPRAKEGREELPVALREAGLVVDEVVVYEMVPATTLELAKALAALSSGRVDLVPFASPRTARVLISALRAEGLDPTRILAGLVVGAIGKTTAAALEEEGIAVDVIASLADFEGLLTQMAIHYQNQPRPG